MTECKSECPTLDELTRFVNGMLTHDRLSDVESHLETCTRCVERMNAGLDSDTLVKKLGAFEFVEGQAGPRTSEDPFELGNDSRYELIAELGEGGMGQVFKARHKIMKRTVALKTIRPELINHPEAVKRFAKEVRAAARLSHPNIVTAFDAEQAGDFHMLVMEFVDGESISALVNRQGPLPARKAVDYVCQAARGLQHAHEQKMVHRDIKPQNLMLDGNGTVKILDFGLSKFRKDLVTCENDSVADESILTLNNTSLGTQGFMAPEQAADARSVDIRSDIYSLGCSLFFMLTNRPPGFGAPQDNPSAVADVCRFRTDLPPNLPELLARMMAHDPADRYESPQAVIDALQTIDWTSSLDHSSRRSGSSQLPQNQTVDFQENGIMPVWAIVIGILVLLATIVALLSM